VEIQPLITNMQQPPPDSKVIAVFALANPWVQSVISEVAAAAAPECQVMFLDPANPQQIAALLPQAHFLVTLKLPPDWVPYLQQCRLVQVNGVGYDAVDRQGLDAAGIPFAISPQGTAVSVAEHTILFILALSKQLLPVHSSLAQGHFDMFGWRENSYTLHGKTLGIVGLGRIGRQVARLAHAFGTRIIYNDLVRAPLELETQLDLSPVDFNTAISQADIVTVHVPLTPLTQKMFGAAEFGRMRPGALYINTSRGGTYDLDALYAALAGGHLRGTGLDIFAPEPPPPNHPLLQLPQVLCTPHMASGTVDRHRAVAKGQFANFQRILQGESPHDLIDFQSS